MNPSRTELLRWQLADQFLTSPAPGTAVAAGLCGLQAQYLSNAVYSLYLRSGSADTAGLVKSWTLRGTLHLFPASDFFLYHPDAPGVEGIFETPYGRWLYNGHCAVPRERMLLFARTVAGGLGDAPVSRDALRELCRQAGMTRQEEERVFDGWGGVIRLLSEAGVLCGSPREARMYLRAPALPPVRREQAELELVRRYLLHYGPTTLRDGAYFFRWPQKKLRELFAAADAKTLAFGGRTYFYLTEPESLPPLPRCVFLAGFDPLLLGHEKKESLYLPPAHLRDIFNNTGIVFPALLADGVVKGKWKEQPRRIEVILFEPLSRPQQQAMLHTAARLWPDKPVVLVQRSFDF